MEQDTLHSHVALPKEIVSAPVDWVEVAGEHQTAGLMEHLTHIISIQWHSFLLDVFKIRQQVELVDVMEQITGKLIETTLHSAHAITWRGILQLQTDEQ